jgi:hypothetical protein
MHKIRDHSIDTDGVRQPLLGYGLRIDVDALVQKRPKIGVQMSSVRFAKSFSYSEPLVIPRSVWGFWVGGSSFAGPVRESQSAGRGEKTSTPMHFGSLLLVIRRSLSR